MQHFAPEFQSRVSAFSCALPLGSQIPYTGERGGSAFIYILRSITLVGVDRLHKYTTDQRNNSFIRLCKILPPPIMPDIYGGHLVNGAWPDEERALGWEAMADISGFTLGDESRHDVEERGRKTLSPTLQIPKNRSTGNLGVIGDSSEKARIRFSFDAGAAAAEYDTMTRLAWPTRG